MSDPKHTADLLGFLRKGEVSIENLVPYARHGNGIIRVHVLDVVGGGEYVEEFAMRSESADPIMDLERARDFVMDQIGLVVSAFGSIKSLNPGGVEVVASAPAPVAAPRRRVATKVAAKDAVPESVPVQVQSESAAEAPSQADLGNATQAVPEEKAPEADPVEQPPEEVEAGDSFGIDPYEVQFPAGTKHAGKKLKDVSNEIIQWYAEYFIVSIVQKQKRQPNDDEKRLAAAASMIVGKLK